MSVTKAIRNVFTKMNTDVSQIKQDNTSFYDALDFRLVSDEALSNGALVNFKGTKARLTLGGTTGSTEVELKGYNYIGDTIILLLYNVYNDYSYISISNILEDSPLNPYHVPYIPTPTKIYSDQYSTTKLNFNSVDYISTVTRYESINSQKLYFAVKGEPLRYINIIDAPTFSITNAIDASILDIIPNNLGGAVEIDIIIEGGNLQAGKIQYCYRLFKKYGAETTFSTTSELISLTSSSAKGIVEFKGSDLEDKVNKSIKINITDVDTEFDYINIYSIFYSEKGLTTINLVGELPIISDTISFIDTGKVLDVITLEEFNNFGGRLFSPSDLETKNNILFAAGIQEDTNDIDIDCRAYRYESTVTGQTFASMVITLESIPINNQLFTIYIPTGQTLNFTAKEETFDQFAGEFLIDAASKLTPTTQNLLDTINVVLKTINTSYNATIYNSGGYRYSIKIEYQTSTAGSFAEIVVEDWVSASLITAYSGTALRHSRVYQQDDSYYEITYNGYFNSVSITPEVTGSDWALPETADCINKFNDEFLQTADDYSVNHPYSYDKTADGLYYGGTGPVVSYKIELDNNAYALTQIGYQTTVDNYNKEFILQTSSHKQGEVYRYSLVFKDLKGRPYFAKWIGDIRIPYLEQFTFGGTYVGLDMPITAKNIKITFAVNLSNISDSVLSTISGFNLARVERTESDKSIITQGVSWITGYDPHTSKEDNLFMHKSFPLAVEGDGKYVIKNEVECNADVCEDLRKDYIHPLYSPELFYNDGIDLNNGDYRIKIVKIFGDFHRASKTTAGIKYFVSDGGTPIIFSFGDLGSEVSSSIIYPISYITEVDSVLNTNDNIIYLNQSFSTLDSFKLLRTESGNIHSVTIADPLLLTDKEVNFINRVLPYNNNYGDNVDNDFITMYGPTCGLFISNKPIFKVFNGRIAYVMDIYRNNATTRYGGNTYYDRLLNSYIIVGEFTKVTTATSYTSTIINCDTYNTIYDAITSIHDPKLTDGSDLLNNPTGGSSYVARQQVVALLPIESSINCFLTNVKPSKYVLTTPYATGRDQDSDKIGLQETTAQGVDLYGSSYPTEFRDLNSYNTAYSTVPLYPTAEPKPQLFEASKDSPNMIIASEVKISDEIVDSWTKFLYANVIEVESEYGDIHRLEAFNNKLYYFQDNGIGTVAVNDRYIINNQDAGQLALGTGGILERFDYIKYNEGIIDPRHLINAKSSIYFMDHNRRVLDNIDTGDQSLSTALGVNSLVRSLYTDETSHVAFGYNPRFKEVMITLGDKTLVFNENTKSFAPRHSTVPLMYLKNDYKMLSYIEDEDVSATYRYIYQHDLGERGEFYSEAYLNDYSTSFVKVVVNPNLGQVCLYDYIKFNTEVYDDGDNVDTASDLIEDTINTINCKNTYQSLNKTLVVDTEAIRASGEFDFNVNTSRRARYWNTQLPLTEEGSKLVDNTLILTLNYANNNNKLFKLQDLITYYTPVS